MAIKANNHKEERKTRIFLMKEDDAVFIDKRGMTDTNLVHRRLEEMAIRQGQQSDSVSRVCKHIKDIMMYAGLPVISQDMDSGGRFWNGLKS